MNLPDSGRLGVGCPSGSQTLEAALLLPLFALVLLAAFQAIGVVADASAVQEAARRGVRVAMTTADDAAVRAEVVRVLGPGRSAVVEVTANRRADDAITVEVTIESTFGPMRPRVSGQATARGEPSLDSP